DPLSLHDALPICGRRGHVSCALPDGRRVREASSPLSLSVHHPDQVFDLGDHSPGLRRIRKLHNAPDPVETESDQRLALAMVTPNGAADLFDLDDLIAVAHLSLSARLI